MVKSLRKNKKRKAKKVPPVQPIPPDIKKGDPVLYMLQRVSDGRIMLVDYVVTAHNKKRETYLHDLFRDKAFRMTPRVKPPRWNQGHQVKFGISSNLQARLNAICENPSESGVTEWRRLSNFEIAIAHNKFWWWKYRGTVYKWAFTLALLVLGVWYLIDFINSL